MQTSRRSILKGGILASLAGTMGATAMSASAAEKQAALPKKEYDLVICGLGIGGIVTAIRAAEDGLKPVILEKMSSASGNTIYSAGFMLGVNTKMQQEKKLETGDTVDKFYEDMMKVSQGRGDPKLTRLVAEKADETLNWLHDYVGVKYAVGMKLVGPMLQSAHLSIGEKNPGGTQLMLATLFLLLGLMVQLFLPTVKIDWITISCGALMMSKFSSDMVLQTDGLTQLVNRLGYEHYLARLRVPATILMVDVDRFKDVNDCHGHLMGDACLRTIAGCIRRAYGNYGTCFRIGGDEFCVILTRRNAQYNTMAEIFQHLMDAARAENPVLPTVSVGCSHFNPSTDELADSLARADARMYQNKEAHR